MHLFLIRHGETEHNVAGLLAGSTDSILTNHGMQQILRLAKFLTTDRDLQFTSIFSSDLQRAYMTAEELHKAQRLKWKEDYQVGQVVQLKVLQELDFGSLELGLWSSKQLEDEAYSTDSADFKPKETAAAMRLRADSFVEDYILPLLAIETETSQARVAVVSHGLFLSTLWNALMAKFKKLPISQGSSLESPSHQLPFWTNTGYLELEIKPIVSSPANLELVKPASADVLDGNTLFSATIKILTINGKEHLNNLKRTRGGVGSAPYDSKQKNLDGFFKRRSSKIPDELSSDR